MISNDFLKGLQVEARVKYLIPDEGKMIVGVEGGIEQSDDFVTQQELTSGLEGKADESHTHDQSDITGLVARLNEIEGRLDALE